MIMIEKFYTENDEINKQLDKIRYIDETLTKISKTTIKNILGKICPRLSEPFDFEKHILNLEKYFNDHPEASIYSNNKDMLKLKFGEKIGMELYNEIQSKNPFRNHKGTLSPFKKGSNNYSKEAIKKASKNRKYTNRIDYYLDKGMSLEDAQKALSERQRTFSLEKCIKKYGKTEGFKRWRERQDKWLKTLNNKTEEEKRKINMKKHSGSGNIDNNVPCKLYYIKFFSDDLVFWKVGITTKTLEKRFGLKLLKFHHNLDYEVIFEKEYNNFSYAFIREQMILHRFDDERIMVDFNGFKTTEAFRCDVLGGDNEIHKIL